jgi:hypothetical protein
VKISEWKIRGKTVDFSSYLLFKKKRFSKGKSSAFFQPENSMEIVG